MATVTDVAPARGGFLRRHLGWLLLVAAIALAAGGILWWRALSQRPQYMTAAVTRGNIQRNISMTGALNPLVTVQVGSYVSGTVKSLKCDFNTEVVIGQVCATIDPLPFQLIVDEDRAQVRTEEAQIRKDRAAQLFGKTELDRDSKLLTEGTVSQDAVDNDRSVYDQATAQIGLDQATLVDRQATLKAAEVNLAYTNIVSPVVGTVITRSIDVGQTVAASLASPTLFIIGKDLTKMQVDTNASEADVGAVRVGQSAFFSVQSFPGRTFHGRVTQIRHGPITVQNIVTYDVVVAFDNPDRALFPGMTADTHIVIDEHDNVLRVPLPAVRFTPEGVARAGRSARSAAGTEAPAGEQTAAGTEAGSQGQGATAPGENGAGRGDGEGGEGGGGRRRRGGEAGGGRRFGGGGGFGGDGSGERRHGGGRGSHGGGRGRSGRVWVLRGDKLVPVAVTMGLDDGALIEVSGKDLHAGDVVVVNEASQEEHRRTTPGAGQGGPGGPGNQGGLGFRGGPRL